MKFGYFRRNFGQVDVMEEAKAKRAEEKRLAEQRVQEGKAGGGGDGVSRDEMHDPAHFFRLGLKMLLPPVRAADFARPCSLSWFRASRLRPLGFVCGFFAQGTSTTRPSAAEPAPEPEPEPAAEPPSPTGGGEDGGGGMELQSMPRSGGGRGRRRGAVGDLFSQEGLNQVSAEGGALGTEGGDAVLDSSGQLNLKSEEVVRGAAALLFPGEVSPPSPFVLCTSPFAQSETEADEKAGCARQFVFDPCAQDGAERGLRLARRLGASDAAGIVGVQQALVRKLAREYLKLRFREGLADVPPVGGV